MSEKEIHTTVRIPNEIDNKIVEIVTELNRKRDENMRNSWPGTVVTKSDWIRDAIREKIKNEIPLETLIERYNELRSEYGYRMEDEDVQYVSYANHYSCDEQEMIELWNGFLRATYLRNNSFLIKETLSIQDKIDELILKLEAYGSGFSIPRKYTFYEELSIDDRVLQLLCKDSFEIAMICDNDASTIAYFYFTGVRWIEGGYRKIPVE